MREKLFYIGLTIVGLAIWTIGGVIEAIKDRLGIHENPLR